VGKAATKTISPKVNHKHFIPGGREGRIPRRRRRFPPKRARGSRTRRVYVHGTQQGDGPGTWEAHVPPRQTPERRRPGHHSPTRRAPVDARAAGRRHASGSLHRRSIHAEVDRRQGRPDPRSMAAGESEGCVRASTSGQRGGAALDNRSPSRLAAVSSRAAALAGRARAASSSADWNVRATSRSTSCRRRL